MNVPCFVLTTLEQVDTVMLNSIYVTTNIRQLLSFKSGPVSMFCSVPVQCYELLTLVIPSGL